MSHIEVAVKVTAFVDEGVAPLVEALNATNRILTVSSCQGDGQSPSHVYFRYAGSDRTPERFYFEFAGLLARQTEFECLFELVWRQGYDEPMAKIEVSRADVLISARWLCDSLPAAVGACSDMAIVTEHAAVR